MPSRLGQFAQSIISRRKPHTREIDKAPAIEQPSSSTAPFIFESLEPRLLLATDPLGISAGYAINEASGTTTADASGNGNIGTLVNGPIFTTAGKYGNKSVKLLVCAQHSQRVLREHDIFANLASKWLSIALDRETRFAIDLDRFDDDGGTKCQHRRRRPKLRRSPLGHSNRQTKGPRECEF